MNLAHGLALCCSALPILVTPSIARAEDDGPILTVVVANETSEEALLPSVVLDRRGDLRRKVRAVSGEPVPEGYRLETSGEPGLWATGVGMLSAGVLLSSLGAAVGYGLSGEGGFCPGYSSSGNCSSGSGEKNDGYLWGLVPLIGGFLAAGDSRIDSDGRIAFAAFGVAQNIGLGLVIAGAAWRHDVWVLDPEVPRGPRVRAGLGQLSFETEF